jgi:hypothetical protein
LAKPFLSDNTDRVVRSIPKFLTNSVPNNDLAAEPVMQTPQPVKKTSRVITDDNPWGW